MQWKKAPQELISTFDKAMEALPEAEKRKIFGYPCAFINGQMFAGLHQGSFIMRLSSEDREAFLKLEGAAPFEPMPGRPMKEYVVAPEALLRSIPELQGWLRKAFSYVESLPPKQPRTGKTAQRATKRVKAERP